MAVTINGSTNQIDLGSNGTIANLAVGGVPDGTIDADALASGAATDATKLPLAGGTITGEVIHNTTGATQLPAGTTAQRPGSPTAGDTRFNSCLLYTSPSPRDS